MAGGRAEAYHVGHSGARQPLLDTGQMSAPSASGLDEEVVLALLLLLLLRVNIDF